VPVLVLTLPQVNHPVSAASGHSLKQQDSPIPASPHVTLITQLRVIVSGGGCCISQDGTYRLVYIGLRPITLYIAAMHLVTFSEARTFGRYNNTSASPPPDCLYISCLDDLLRVSFDS
jgi:hypothetical protein